MARFSDLVLGEARLKDFTFKRKLQSGGEQDVHVKIKILNKEELKLARVNALKTVNALGDEFKDGRTHEELLEDERVAETLAVALRDPEDPSRQWATPGEISTGLHNIELAAIYEAYEAHQAEQGPIVAKMTLEEFEATVELCAMEGDHDPLLLFARPLRKSFTHSLARELLLCRMENASLSSELNDLKIAGSKNSSESESQNSVVAGLSEDDYETLLARIKADIAEAAA